jgi:hypothetical protein
MALLSAFSLNIIVSGGAVLRQLDYPASQLFMRLLFVHPGPLLYTNVFLRLEPLGLELVTRAARRAGYSTRLIDLQVENQADYHRIMTRLGVAG